MSSKKPRRSCSASPPYWPGTTTAMPPRTTNPIPRHGRSWESWVANGDTDQATRPGPEPTSTLSTNHAVLVVRHPAGQGRCAAIETLLSRRGHRDHAKCTGPQRAPSLLPGTVCWRGRECSLGRRFGSGCGPSLRPRCARSRAIARQTSCGIRRPDCRVTDRSALALHRVGSVRGDLRPSVTRVVPSRDQFGAGSGCVAVCVSTDRHPACPTRPVSHAIHALNELS